LRSQRFALVAKNGIVDDLQIEAPGKFEVSAAEFMLARLARPA
jgi:peroxiredoxin